MRIATYNQVADPADRRGAVLILLKAYSEILCYFDNKVGMILLPSPNRLSARVT